MAKQEPVTPPIQIGQIVLGSKTGTIEPFEDATADFAHINDYLIKNPAYQQHVIPDALVSSCSQCCMETINGQPNILGRLFRKSRGDLGCHRCPVSMASEKLPARDSAGNYVRNKHGQILSEAAVIRMAEDGMA